MFLLEKDLGLCRAGHEKLKVLLEILRGPREQPNPKDDLVLYNHADFMGIKKFGRTSDLRRNNGTT